MRIEHLEYLVCLARTGSITQASTELYTTRQNVSKIIRQLEEELDTTLFIRSQKGIELTAAGRIVLDFAQETISSLAQVRSTLKNMHVNHDLSGDLHLFGSIIPFTTALPDIIQTFGSQYPNINLYMHEDNPLESLRQTALHDNVLGLLPILSDARFHDIYTPYLDQLQTHRLQNDAYLCCTGSQSPLTKYKSVSIAQFLQYPVVWQQDNELLLQAFQQFGEVNIGFSSNNTHLYLNALTTGRYVGITTQQMYTNRSPLPQYEQLTVLPFTEDMSFQTCLAHRKVVQPSPLCQAFIDFVYRNYAVLEN